MNGNEKGKARRAYKEPTQQVRCGRSRGGTNCCSNEYEGKIHRGMKQRRKGLQESETEENAHLQSKPAATTTTPTR